MRCRDEAAGSLTDRRSRRTALSTVDTSQEPPGLANSEWTSKRQASRAMTRRHLGCIGNHPVTDYFRVHQ